MELPPFDRRRLIKNMDVLAVVAPETAYWLGRTPTPEPPEFALGMGEGALAHLAPNPGGISVVVGSGRPGEVLDVLWRMPSGHQVFWLEPRAELVKSALGRLDVANLLSGGDLVILAPNREGLRDAFERHPQLALCETVDLIHQDEIQEAPDWHGQEARGTLYRLLGHALHSRDMSVKWDEPRGVNLVSNLDQAAFMGGALGLPGCLTGRAGVIALDGPSLEPALERLAGHLGGAALICSDQALPRVLAAGVMPTAVVLTRPGLGPLSSFGHPDLDRLPLVAEEVSHAPTVRAHTGPRLVCLGARGTGLGPLKALAAHFTPQEHALGRAAELAGVMGCDPLVLIGADLCGEEGNLCAPGVSQTVKLNLGQAGEAHSLTRVVKARRIQVLNASQGAHLPLTRSADLDQAAELCGPAGQPLRAEPLDRPRWLGVEGLSGVAAGLEEAAAGAAKLGERAALPVADMLAASGQEALQCLRAADGLFVALAEQAAADPLQASFLEGCLVRAFLRRHRLVCSADVSGVTGADACAQLGLCLADLRDRAGELALGLKEASEIFASLARARAADDHTTLEAFAASAGWAGVDLSD